MAISSWMKPNIWYILKQLEDEKALKIFKITNVPISQPMKDDYPGRIHKCLQREENLTMVVNI